jgi:hypothetical protein
MQLSSIFRCLLAAYACGASGNYDRALVQRKIPRRVCIILRQNGLTYRLPRGLPMAKPNYSFAKRQRDLAKEQKKEEKAQRKQAEKAEALAGEGEVVEGESTEGSTEGHAPADLNGSAEEKPAE